jgi:diacylglycerol diphosphate phosphatase/phosphatidate phosphatase
MTGSFWDMNNAIIGLLYSLITAAVFQVFLKWLIGGLRPHFLTVCNPIIPDDGTELGNGFKQIYYDRSICSGDRNSIDDSLESFPSGHSTAAFAGFIFLYLYLNAKLKAFSNHHPAMWKLVATYAPVLGATLIAGTLTIDEYHNWYDVSTCTVYTWSPDEVLTPQYSASQALSSEQSWPSVPTEWSMPAFGTSASTTSP